MNDMAFEQSVLEALSSVDRVFHNERDFQISLIRELDRKVGGAVRPEIPIEYQNGKDENRTELDIAHYKSGRRTAIELKYPLDDFSGTHTVEGLDEVFHNNGTSPYDVPLYGFWKDIATLETLVKREAINAGYVLLLTNMSGCWEKRGDHLNASEFFINEGREVSNEVLPYSEEASETTRKQYPSLTISGSYKISWSPYEYSQPSQARGNTRFLYTLIRVDPES